MVKRDDETRGPALTHGAQAALQRRFSGQFCILPEILRLHSGVSTWLKNVPPEGVVYCESKGDVIDAIAICRDFRVPVIPFGAGTSLEGQVNAACGGIALDLSRMNAMIELSVTDRLVTVQPGLTHVSLNDRLHASSSFFPVDPGAAATIGGMISTRASGTNAVHYGTMRENTISLEVVLASGEVVRTRSKAKKSSSGYDLTSLFVGAEGTLGVIVEATLRIFPLPDVVLGGRCIFPDISSATHAVVQSIALGIDFARVELLDTVAISACNQHSNLALSESPTLFFEFHGTQESVSYNGLRFQGLASHLGGNQCTWSSDPIERERLWEARHNLWWAIHELFPGRTGVTTDVCVPVSQLSTCVEAAQSDLARLQLTGPILGHVGDGNFHVLLMLTPGDDNQLQGAREFIDRLNQRAISCGGTCSGEHGIGEGKIFYAALEHGPAISVMRAIKLTLDPLNIMNPGKLFN